MVNHNEEMFVAIWKKYPFIIFFKDRKFHLSHVLPAPATFLIFEKFTRAYFYKQHSESCDCVYKWIANFILFPGH